MIGQAFSAAYKEFLKANGITEEDLEEAEYAHILNAQSRPQVEVESFTDRDKTKKVLLSHKLLVYCIYLFVHLFASYLRDSLEGTAQYLDSGLDPRPG